MFRADPAARPRSDVVHDDRVQDAHRRRGLPGPHHHRDGFPARHDAPLPRLLHPDRWDPGVRFRDPAHRRIRMTLRRCRPACRPGAASCAARPGRRTALSPSMGSRRRDRRNGDRARRTRLAADHQIRSRNACASVRGIPGLCVSRSSSRLLISAFTRHPPTPLIAPSLRHHQRFFCGRFGVRGCSLSSTSISETYSKEISTRTGLARSTTHRLVSELVQWGAITRGDESGDEYMYRVGPLECSALRRRQLVMHRGNQAESGGSGSTPPPGHHPPWPCSRRSGFYKPTSEWYSTTSRSAPDLTTEPIGDDSASQGTPAGCWPGALPDRP